MKDTYVKKGLVVSVILLFIGVAVAPFINQSVVKASSDDDLVEITTQACGIQGYGNNTVKLTREQYQDLEAYLVEFRARLNQTSTREDAVPIFKEAVVELDKYGLLPRGMSVETAQRLILKKYKMMDEFGSRNKSLNINLGCLVAGKVDFEIGFYGRLFLLLSRIWFLTFPLMLMLYILSLVNPVSLGGVITFGSHTIYQHGSQYLPAVGWVTALGILGQQHWNHSFYGKISPIQILVKGGDQIVYYYEFIGAIGFCGIKIVPFGFFIGSALAVSLDSEKPIEVN
ncbi:MAG TPA: hypothetical protein VN377_05565 [Candidatus Thermoplasmatota archaeon]|nr:hypothetical protein [Candidatus Thermoplasmatota archaeon]